MKRLLLLAAVSLGAVACSPGDDGDIVKEVANSPCVYVEITVRRERSDEDKKRHPNGIYCLKNMEQ